jgi:hypothetical protein
MIHSLPLTFLLSVSLSFQVAAFVPCVPPRFDDFSDKLVGKWVALNTYPREISGSIEEVMRSCGGAIQGIREFPPIGNVEAEEGLYLNRANDGFVFHDNGCYSLGPVDWSSEEDTFLASLRFGKSRIVAWCDISRDDDSIVHSIPKILHTKKSFEDIDLLPAEVVKDPNLLVVDFVNKIRCSMPSPGQPWMLQRVKWEREQNNANPETTVEEALGPFQCWATSHSAVEFNKWTGSLTSVLSEGTILNMGAVCKPTGVVKCMARHFDKANKVACVTLLEGRLAE